MAHAIDGELLCSWSDCSGPIRQIPKKTANDLVVEELNYCLDHTRRGERVVLDSQDTEWIIEAIRLVQKAATEAR